MKDIRLQVMAIGLGLLVVVQVGFGQAPAQAPQLGKDPVKSVVAAMTLEEKAFLVVGSRVGGGQPGAPRGEGAPPGATTVAAMQGQVAGAAGTTYAIPRLGIPAFVLADGPAGLRISPTRPNDSATYYCTAFPVSTLVASTWDPDLAYRVGAAVGDELLAYGVDVLLAPALNIHRNPLCGRNFEYYSEDPLIAGRMAGSVVNGVESKGVGTSIKHFAANNAETNRMNLDTVVSERALREIYLEGFRIAVETAQPWTVMSSYNLINGVYAPHSADLLTKVLRDDWKFQGFVMTDWGGGTDPVIMMAAGNDLLMPGRAEQATTILKAVQDGKLSEAELTRNVERILNVLVQTPRFKGYKPSNKPDLKAHAVLAREAAAEGMVLLKNTGAALPLAAALRVAPFGNSSYESITGGTGSGDVNEAYSVSLFEALANGGYAANEEVSGLYRQYLEAAKAKQPPAQGMMRARPPIPEMTVEAALASRAASAADVALITLGRNSGEFADRQAVEGDFYLTPTEKELIKVVSDAFHSRGKKAIVLLNIGGVIETESWRQQPDAILLVWQPGQETGNSIVDVISGKVNPSGKLATTFPVRYEDVPSSKNFPGEFVEPAPTGAAQPQQAGAPPMPPAGAPQRAAAGAPPQAPGGAPGMAPPGAGAGGGRAGGAQVRRLSRVTYEEGIYVGYRYHETFGVKPSFEFGYGLSYTTFDFGRLALSSPRFSGQMTATLEVRNTGKVAGREVVQLYLAAPYQKLDKPAMELKAFAKTRLLKPGESEKVTLALTPRQLASFDPASSSWVAEAGKYDVKVGASSRDIRQTASFTLDKDLTVKKESVALVPKTKINELKRGGALR
jgi:beta-glucosidase